MRRSTVLSSVLFGIAVAGGCAAATPSQVPEHAASSNGAGAPYFKPPPFNRMPTGQFGDMVKLGYEIFTNTQRYAGRYVGNRLNCDNCHLDAGRRPNSAPLWAAYVAYPAYRRKNGHVNTFGQRLQGCFRYSMNGTPPPLGSKTLTALQSYAFWLSRGAPTDEHLAGRGYPRLPKPALSPDYRRGARVYAQRCALCHGAGGQGRLVAGRTVFPPLWGRGSFNWGAGMQSLKNASAFIRANMPLGLGGSLSVQQAWDVAMFVDGHERPQDPRFNGSVAQTRRRYHDSPMSMYGLTVNGHLLGSGTQQASK